MTQSALIVDDSRLACKVLAKMLDNLDILHFEAYSAEDALALLKNKHPDIIFLDHTMPGMDGLEMMKKLKENPATAKIPVLMHTAKEGDIYIKQATALGAAEVLPKGLEEKHLVRVLQRLKIIRSDESRERATDKLELTDKSKKFTDLNVPLDSSQDETSWQTFWLKNVIPYFEKQRTQIQQENQYHTKMQTSRLIRDMHLTLEQFEHALVLRMESHADFVDSTEEVAKSGRRKWLAFVGGVIVFFQAGIFWQLWQSNQTNQVFFSAQQQVIQQHLKSQENILQLEIKLADLETKTQQVQSYFEESSSEQLVLVDEHKTMIADLLPYGSEYGTYSGITSNGYSLIVDANGDIKGADYERYYLAGDCMGDTFVKLDPGTIISDNSSLWYVDKMAEEMPVNINSILTHEKECIALSNEILVLNRLQKNIASETGVDDFQSLQLVFN